MKLTIILLLCLICMPYSQAQDRIVKGNLLSKTGIPFSAYNIVLEGTNIGTQSGICGEFELNIPENFEGNIVISAITPRDWKVKSEKFKNKAFYTVILYNNSNSRKKDVNKNCNTKVDKKNVIKLK